MSDRIKLAEAMYPDHEFSENRFGVPLMAANGRWDKDLAIREVPDPFNDANDDYAVLQWVRKSWRGDKLKKFEGRLMSAWNYMVGDYACTALTVLQQQEQK